MTKPSKQQADSGAPEISAKLPSDFFVPTLATATIDDDDDPADERSGANAAAVRRKNGNTAAAEQCQYDDEDRDGADE
jgi:hypothetical protein